MLSQEKEGAEWKEMQLSPDTDSVSLQDLSFGSVYQLEVTAVNANGSSIPATVNITIGEQPGMWPPTPHTILFSHANRKVLLATVKMFAILSVRSS